MAGEEIAEDRSAPGCLWDYAEDWSNTGMDLPSVSICSTQDRSTPAEEMDSTFWGAPEEFLLWS